MPILQARLGDLHYEGKAMVILLPLMALSFHFILLAMSRGLPAIRVEHKGEVWEVWGLWARRRHIHHLSLCTSYFYNGVHFWTSRFSVGSTGQTNKLIAGGQKQRNKPPVYSWATSGKAQRPLST